MPRWQMTTQSPYYATASFLGYQEHWIDQPTLSGVPAQLWPTIHPRSNPLRPPGYLTIRGLERYEDTLIGLEPTTWIPDQTVIPALRCIRQRAICDTAHGTGQQRSFPGAYAHDFSTYHQARREDAIPLIPRSTQRILDVGGGEGGFLEALKHETACETHLSEHSEAVCEIARKRVDTVWQGDFLDTDFGNVQF